LSGRRQFGAVRKRQSGKWEARYRDSAGQVHYRYFMSANEADKFLATVHTDILRGDWIDPRQATRTVADLAEEWMRSKRNLRPRTDALYRTVLRVHILPVFGTMKLEAVTHEQLEKWLHDQATEGRHSNSTTNRSFKLFSQMMKFALQRRYIRFNPCDPVSPPAEDKRKVVVLTPAQVADLAEAAGEVQPQYRTLVLLAAYGGLRWGECVGLGIGAVNILRATVTVERQLHPDGRLDEPKSDAGTRTVKLPRWLADTLAATIAGRKPSVALRPEHADLVFLSDEGMPLRNANFGRRVWWPTVSAALPEHLQGFRFHDLRHTAVAIAIDSARQVGEPLNAKALQVRMGHASIQMTFDRYGHLLDGHDDGMVEGMADPFANRPSGGAAVPLRRAT